MSRSRRQPNATHMQQGFTLLELLLVVVILSAVAFMTMSTMTDSMSQVHYEDTRNRLDAIRTAIIGSTNPDNWAKGYISGYVADNGRLPENIDALVNRPSGSHVFGTVVPVFDPSPTTNGISNNDGDETEFSDAEYLLSKGHRGVYLIGSTYDSDAGSYVYRDGWGTVREGSGGDATLACPSATLAGYGTAESSDDDDINFGWCVTTHDSNGGAYYDQFYVDSFGMDGNLADSPGTPGQPYETDMLMSPGIVVNDWLQDISGATITLKNFTSVNLSAVDISVSLLVYINGDADEDIDGTTDETSGINLDAGPPIIARRNWRCITSDSFTASSLTGDSTQQDINLTFTGSSADTRVPVGEHLLVLLVGSTPDPDWDSTLGKTSPYYITKRVKFYPRGGVPDMVLEIR